ncbi:MAG: M23 family metallopeptidase, partial [Leptospirales bacterium]|nr:M23 family metallopeptidase [Leptospirales bacterium]
KPEIESIYQISSDTEEIGDLWGYNDFDFDGMEKLLKNKRIISDDIFSMKKVQTDLTNATNIIKTVEKFINERSKVESQMPSLYPVIGGHITSLFGWRRSPFGHGRDFHTGIDIASAPGSRIYASAPGYVIQSGWMGGYGIAVKIKHKYGYETIYAHMSATAEISVNREIKAGTIIGFVGMTGNATGNHCHYEIKLGDVAINPYPYMRTPPPASR